MLADVGMEAALIESSVLSVIIMALWQRARKATLAAMRERNASHRGAGSRGDAYRGAGRARAHRP